MTLPQRRIGLLFAVFLVLLLAGGVRAVWLGVVRADELQAAAVSQQVREVAVPAQRAASSTATAPSWPSPSRPPTCRPRRI